MYFGGIWMFCSFPNFYKRLPILKSYLPHKVISRYENKGKVKLTIKQKLTALRYAVKV